MNSPPRLNRTAEIEPTRPNPPRDRAAILLSKGFGRLLARVAVGGPAVALALALAFAAHVATAQTLLQIRQSHTLHCATNAETPEYSTTDDHGPRLAFDTDLCRAVAIAILGPSARITVTPYPDDVTTAEALRSGKVDLIPTQTLDLTHEDSAVTFTAPILYDGVGLLVPTTSALTQATDLSGKKICFLAETEVETALRTWFTQHRLHFVPFPFQEEGEMEAAFVTGNCAALAGDLTRLADTRQTLGPLAAHYQLLPGQVSEDPLAAVTRADDPAFAAIVRWTLQILLHAESLQLTQQNVTSATSTDPGAAILLGQTREIGSRLNLDPTWAAQVVANIGNYAEIFARTLGAQSPLQLPRNQNRLHTEGGLLYPIPLK